MQKDMFKKMMPPPARVPTPALETRQPHEKADEEDEHKWAPEHDWQKYFSSCTNVASPAGSHNVFRVYCSGPDEGPLFVLLHGGGHTALSWAVTVGALNKANARVVAFDLRGHGETRTDDDSDLSMATLTNDVIGLLHTLYANASPPPPIILVGHSLGGAIAVHAAISGQVKELSGLIVVDVVEGTAMASLSYMDSYISRMPHTFQSLEKAIQWTVRSGAVHNLESARVSVPPRLVQDEDGLYKWKTNLLRTRHLWTDWYQNLSKKFLSCSAAKVLILAGADRLDTELMIGQMQGKFRVVVLPDCGHCVQEDNPEKTADILLELKKRYDLIQSKIKPIPSPHE